MKDEWKSNPSVPQESVNEPQALLILLSNYPTQANTGFEWATSHQPHTDDPNAGGTKLIVPTVFSPASRKPREAGHPQCLKCRRLPSGLHFAGNIRATRPSDQLSTSTLKPRPGLTAPLVYTVSLITAAMNSLVST